ncbi:MAG: membrane protein insertion efficiency factor YidD [Lachnospiraceae bacterium]|nr:membrane protein insertion efficiency factor YidD [Lachnospiraceae bacterium]
MRKILIAPIRFYQKYLSGLKRYSHCKYIPTCSQYAIEAIEKYGPLKGLGLAIWRVL